MGPANEAAPIDGTPQAAASTEATAPTDVALFRSIFAEQFGYVWGSLRRLGIQERDVEDVAQEIFAQVYRRLSSYDRDRPIRPWLFAFAVRAASDYRRLARHRVEVFTEKTPDAEHQGPLSDQMLSDRDRAALVERALETIPLERRAVLVAFELDEQPMKEVAAALDIPLFTAYSRLRTARDEFRDAVVRLQKREVVR